MTAEELARAVGITGVAVRQHLQVLEAAGLVGSAAERRPIGRPRRVFQRDEVVRLRDQEGLSWPEIARRMGAGQGTVVRVYQNLAGAPVAFQNPAA